ncbi:MAG TPA: CoA pyrophosphatase [Chryseosolibacter sp.]|jgi:8-oxo-dGTP pyrophosphatase MutT (NUDIX family)|nr:CoA pyrophosphatase [Chryseosolibacter sp.]
MEGGSYGKRMHGFDEFCERLRDRLAMPLPGADAHARFRARPVGDVRPLFSHKTPPRPGGVIILLYEEDTLFKFPLIKRPDYDGAHGGQVSFPGGKAEPGEDAVQTALRECHEEIGIAPDRIIVLGKLSNFFVMPSNYIVTPVVAAIDIKPQFKPDPFEVSRILEARVEDLTAEGSIREKEIIAAGKYRMLAPHFEIGGEVVWGATAMMLNEFRMVLADGVL